MNLVEIENDRIVTIKAIENPSLALKLLEYGCAIGTPIKVVRPAPLGCPIALEAHGYTFCIRCEEAKLIEVV